jgi:hypothetical protein
MEPSRPLDAVSTTASATIAKTTGTRASKDRGGTSKL